MQGYKLMPEIDPTCLGCSMAFGHKNLLECPNAHIREKACLQDTVIFVRDTTSDMAAYWALRARERLEVEDG